MVLLGLILFIASVVTIVTCACVATRDDVPVPLIAAGFIISPIAGIAGLVMALSTPSVSCQSAPGDQVQWRVYQGGKNPQYYVYLASPGQKQTFCRVNDQSLFGMGLGYTTTRAYAGVLEVQP